MKRENLFHVIIGWINYLNVLSPMVRSMWFCASDIHKIRQINGYTVLILYIVSISISFKISSFQTMRLASTGGCQSAEGKDTDCCLLLVWPAVHSSQSYLWCFNLPFTISTWFQQFVSIIILLKVITQSNLNTDMTDIILDSVWLTSMISLSLLAMCEKMFINPVRIYRKKILPEYAGESSSFYIYFGIKEILWQLSVHPWLYYQQEILTG